MSKLEITRERDTSRRRLDTLSAGELFAFEPDSAPQMLTTATGSAAGMAYVSLVDGSEDSVAGHAMVCPITATLTIK